MRLLIGKFMRLSKNGEPVEKKGGSLAPLRPWKWGTLPTYNGFTHHERVRGGQLIWWFIDNGWLPAAAKCSISGSTERVQNHCEDYYLPWVPIPICQPIHLALHKRFREPEVWNRIVAAHASTGDEWFCRLPMTPINLAADLRERQGNGMKAIFSRAPLPAGVKLPAEIAAMDTEI
jgi:hypothetical protein